MTVYTFDPLQDQRWCDLVERHPLGSVFHTTAWLRALQHTYGYEPIVFTTSAPGATLEDGVAFCHVNSWLTGNRLVSLPFSDHCEPLVSNPTAFQEISTHVDRVRRDRNWDYVEFRPRTNRFHSEWSTTVTERYWFHQLDLRPSEQSLYAALHKDSTQRKIRRADREGLEYSDGSGESELNALYQLVVMTRRRHQLLPQPLSWFRNLAATFAGAMKIRVASHRGRPVAAIVTLRHGDTMVYKYGASNAEFHSLGGMHLLFWRTIQEARASGCATLDMGRCDIDNHGLARFKERWGAARSEITYWRHGDTSVISALRRHALTGGRQLLDHAPGACRVAVGRFLYRHAG
jgi:CelD/BcsL family acetyltransferase involved in cellulose biosynthesis